MRTRKTKKGAPAKNMTYLYTTTLYHFFPEMSSKKERNVDCSKIARTGSIPKKETDPVPNVAIRDGGIISDTL